MANREICCALLWYLERGVSGQVTGVWVEGEERGLSVAPLQGHFLGVLQGRFPFIFQSIFSTIVGSQMSTIEVYPVWIYGCREWGASRGIWPKKVTSIIILLGDDRIVSGR